MKRMTQTPEATDTSFVATRLPPLIGAAFGLLFVLINAGALPAPWSLGVRVAGVVLTAAVVARVLLGRTEPAPPPEPTAMRTYWRWVGMEALAIPAGSILLSRFGLADFGALWVILVVGVHFLPFSTAFRRREYAALGWALIAVALAGVALTLSFGAIASGLAGVVAGVLLLVFALTFGGGRRLAG